MEYKKLTEEEANNVTPGICVNFGNGTIWEVIELISTKTRSFLENGERVTKQDQLIKAINKKTGRVIEGYSFGLTQGTTESMDPTIEKCEQCGSLRPANEMKTALIWERKPARQVSRRFCADKPCAEHRQMGAEG